MKKLLPWIVAALVAVPIVSRALVVAQSQTSAGGAFLPAINYVVSGVWTFKGASPLVFEGATNDGKTTTLSITDPTANRTWTVQDATDTFVGLATTDILTNKTLTSPTVTTPTISSPLITSFLDLNAAGGGANGDRYKVYRVDSLADATATDIVTVTVPNAAHAAVIPVVILTGLGAGGAVGDWECAGTGYGQVVVERVAGAATVATAVAISNTGSACSSGATTITTAYSVSTMTGANSAQQTFTIKASVTKGGGSSANHHVIFQVDALNANATGITIS